MTSVDMNNVVSAPYTGVLGLHHLQLAIPAGAEDACRAFWCDLLGLTEVPKPPPMAARGGAWFRGAGFELHVGVDPAFTPAAKAHPAILVDDIDALSERLAAAGIAVTWSHDFPGHRHFYSPDPVGNRIEFISPDPVS
ncbi:Catechol 2,3-dioxygenase [Parafrankia irregularis]|uniref:Catechol 2,3-dioxygenase n=1 Tax=Parafrankia irregularis TaxID=795642 RepID=A0A0S4QDR2_9ACTN|nr:MULTISPECIES: VOC family protein [Parafrankia]MBE3199740.1 VOC family protein [Parafrankia sp. CH37]CUU53587.1 Catechol 2,3-dioxygenase [Parafrankia irregularis]